jgi:hypothetical protein
LRQAPSTLLSSLLRCAALAAVGTTLALLAATRKLRRDYMTGEILTRAGS